MSEKPLQWFTPIHCEEEDLSQTEPMHAAGQYTVRWGERDETLTVRTDMQNGMGDEMRISPQAHQTLSCWIIKEVSVFFFEHSQFPSGIWWVASRKRRKKQGDNTTIIQYSLSLYVNTCCVCMSIFPHKVLQVATTVSQEQSSVYTFDFLSLLSASFRLIHFNTLQSHTYTHTHARNLTFNLTQLTMSFQVRTSHSCFVRAMFTATDLDIVNHNNNTRQSRSTIM